MPDVLCPYRKGAESTPSAPALSENGTVLTYQEVDGLINRTAFRLQTQLAISPGDCVGIIPANTFSSVACIFALQRINALVLLLNSRLTNEVMLKQLEAAKAKLVLGQVEAGPQNFDIQELLRESDSEEVVKVPAVLRRSREATIIFTSGSTGIGKGTVLSVGNHFASAEAANCFNGLSPQSKWLVSLPLFHVGGLEILYRTSLAGAAAVLTTETSAEALAEIIRSEKITHISLVPVMLMDLIEYDHQCLRSLEFIMLGGAPSGKRLLQAIETYQLPIRTSYGMTETTSHIALLRPEHGLAKISTAGAPLPHCDVRLLNEANLECKTGEVGRIVVRGESIAKRYLDQSAVDEQGWFATRDLGSFDEQGCLTIHGREDDVIISGGENISLHEITAAAENAPGVSACAAVGVSDERWGQRPVLFIESENKQIVSELEAILQEKLPAYKRPKRIIVLKELPRKGIGKIDYPALRRLTIKD